MRRHNPTEHMQWCATARRVNSAAEVGEGLRRKEYEPMMTSPDLPGSYGTKPTMRFLYKIRIDMHERALGRGQLTRLSEVGQVSAGLPA